MRGTKERGLHFKSTALIAETRMTEEVFCKLPLASSAGIQNNWESRVWSRYTQKYYAIRIHEPYLSYDSEKLWRGTKTIPRLPTHKPYWLSFWVKGKNRAELWRTASHLLKHWALLLRPTAFYMPPVPTPSQSSILRSTNEVREQYLPRSSRHGTYPSPTVNAIIPPSTPGPSCIVLTANISGQHEIKSSTRCKEPGGHETSSLVVVWYGIISKKLCIAVVYWLRPSCATNLVRIS
jgi:hypothetical protein